MYVDVTPPGSSRKIYACMRGTSGSESYHRWFHRSLAGTSNSAEHAQRLWMLFNYRWNQLRAQAKRGEAKCGHFDLQLVEGIKALASVLGLEDPYPSYQPLPPTTECFGVDYMKQYCVNALTRISEGGGSVDEDAEDVPGDTAPTVSTPASTLQCVAPPPPPTPAHTPTQQLLDSQQQHATAPPPPGASAPGSTPAPTAAEPSLKTRLVLGARAGARVQQQQQLPGGAQPQSQQQQQPPGGAQQCAPTRAASTSHSSKPSHHKQNRAPPFAGNLTVSHPLNTLAAPVETEREVALVDELMGKHVDAKGQVRPQLIMTEFNKRAQEEWAKYTEGSTQHAPADLRFKFLTHIQHYITGQERRAATFVNAAIHSPLFQQQHQAMLRRTAPPQAPPDRARARQLSVAYPPRPYASAYNIQHPDVVPRAADMPLRSALGPFSHQAVKRPLQFTPTQQQQGDNKRTRRGGAGTSKKCSRPDCNGALVADRQAHVPNCPHYRAPKLPE